MEDNCFMMLCCFLSCNNTNYPYTYIYIYVNTHTHTHTHIYIPSLLSLPQSIGFYFWSLTMLFRLTINWLIFPQKCVLKTIKFLFCVTPQPKNSPTFSSSKINSFFPCLSVHSRNNIFERKKTTFIALTPTLSSGF